MEDFVRERSLVPGRGGGVFFVADRSEFGAPPLNPSQNSVHPPLNLSQNPVHPPPNAKTMREIDTRYLVISLAVITLNKHTTCCIYSLYATGVHIIS